MSKRPNTGRTADKPAGWKRGNESLIPAKGTTPAGKRAPAKAAKASKKKK